MIKIIASYNNYNKCVYLIELYEHTVTNELDNWKWKRVFRNLWVNNVRVEYKEIILWDMKYGWEENKTFFVCFKRVCEQSYCFNDRQ